MFLKKEPINNIASFKSEKISPSSKKKNINDMLNVISQNIEKNSLNLNNPHYFYQKYFSALMNKTDNKSMNNITDRLKNIAKMIENNTQKNSSYVSSKLNIDEEEENKQRK